MPKSPRRRLVKSLVLDLLADVGSAIEQAPIPFRRALLLPLEVAFSLISATNDVPPEPPTPKPEPRDGFGVWLLVPPGGGAPGFNGITKTVGPDTYEKSAMRAYGLIAKYGLIAEVRPYSQEQWKKDEEEFERWLQDRMATDPEYTTTTCGPAPPRRSQCGVGPSLSGDSRCFSCTDNTPGK